ncbi:hypothetical protein E2C01_016343 [Portunus trituberculatus]|uniref:Uncharacterized protein n=1 Tax=Portunus trituberculatus TaxID=210409 RepID=A0A5B7DQC3_PORTR|nr:hypothetical protein [Portunus trituberculatus]
MLLCHQKKNLEVNSKKRQHCLPQPGDFSVLTVWLCCICADTSPQYSPGTTPNTLPGTAACESLSCTTHSSLRVGFCTGLYGSFLALQEGGRTVARSLRKHQLSLFPCRACSGIFCCTTRLGTLTLTRGWRSHARRCQYKRHPKTLP